uniref:Protein transport protein sec16 n=1 Tax=Mesocestoides corti TaxID=53468 RepID=A0A5K3FL03_MESCO
MASIFFVLGMSDESSDELFASADEGSDNEHIVLQSSVKAQSTTGRCTGAQGDESRDVPLGLLIDISTAQTGVKKFDDATQRPDNLHSTTDAKLGNFGQNRTNEWDSWDVSSASVADKDQGVECYVHKEGTPKLSCRPDLVQKIPDSSTDPWFSDQVDLLQSPTADVSGDLLQPVKVTSGICETPDQLHQNATAHAPSDVTKTQELFSVPPTAQEICLTEVVPSREEEDDEDSFPVVKASGTVDKSPSEVLPQVFGNAAVIGEDNVGTLDGSQLATSKDDLGCQAIKMSSHGTRDSERRQGRQKETGVDSSLVEGSREGSEPVKKKVESIAETDSWGCEQSVDQKVDESEPVEEGDAWDLEDDPWTSPKTAEDEFDSEAPAQTVPSQDYGKGFAAKSGGFAATTTTTTTSSNSMGPNSRDSNRLASQRHVWDDDDAWNIGDNWDSVEDIDQTSGVKSSPPQQHEEEEAERGEQEFASVATALVKSVGGGLVNLVEGFKLANLSSTLSAFDENPTAGRPVSCDAPEHHQPADAPQPSNESSSGWTVWGLGSLAKSLTSTVENTGMQLLHGGVDVLEHIGRKTFTALKENDPGLVYTKRIFRPVEREQTTSSLSQLLREASSHPPHETSASGGPACVSAARRGDFVSQLESRLGTVHMEALELLSSRASARLGTKLARLEAVTGDDQSSVVDSLTREGGVLDKIWHTLHLKDREAEETEEACGFSASSLSDALSVLDAVVPGSTLQKTCSELQEKSKHLTSDLPVMEIFCCAIEALAEVTASNLAYLHKLSECLLLAQPDRLITGFLDIAEKVSIVVTESKMLNDCLCSTYGEHLNQTTNSSDLGEVTTNRRLVANLFLETNLANGYLDEAAAHLAPIMQVACVDSIFPEQPIRRG